MIIENILPSASTSDLGISAVDEEDFEISTDGTVSVAVPPYEIVSQSTGTDEQIVAMVQAADDGLIDLTEYQAVGDERQVSLSAMAASGSNDYGSWSVGETHVAQTVTLVLMDTNHYELVTSVLDKNKNTRNTCSFVVGQKNMLANGTTREGGYMNSSMTNSGSWNGCARRGWCNAAYPAALPSNLVPAFKQFKVGTIQTYNGSSMQTSEDLFALFAEKEIFGAQTYSNPTEASNLTQIEYYKTSSNRVKKAGDAGSGSLWWERSLHYNGSYYFCCVYSTGSASYDYANDSYGLAPFGCI